MSRNWPQAVLAMLVTALTVTAVVSMERVREMHAAESQGCTCYTRGAHEVMALWVRRCAGPELERKLRADFPDYFEEPQP